MKRVPCRSPRNAIRHLKTLFFTRYVRYICLSCVITLVLMKVFVTPRSTSQSITLARISKYFETSQKDIIETFLIKQSNGTTYIAFQIPSSTKIGKANIGGQLTLWRKIQALAEKLADEKHIAYEIEDRLPLSTRADPYAINNEHICKGVNNLVFVVLVHSSSTNFDRRRSIRETWANYHIFKNQTMRIVFLLGQPEENTTKALIEHENSLHHDIIQGRFKDTYHNLTHKGVLGIRWVSEFCKESKTIVKVDDDVFVNVFKLMDDVINLYSKASRKIHCRLREKGTSPIERHEGKWKIGDSFFRNMTHFPFPHCNGFIIIFTADIVRQMYNAARKTPFLWLDDVYVYGMLPDKVKNITFVNLMDITIDEESSLKCFESKNQTCELLVGNAHSEGLMDKLWYFAVEQYKGLVKRYAPEILV